MAWYLYDRSTGCRVGHETTDLSELTPYWGNGLLVKYRRAHEDLPPLRSPLPKPSLTPIPRASSTLPAGTAAGEMRELMAIATSRAFRQLAGNEPPIRHLSRLVDKPRHMSGMSALLSRMRYAYAAHDDEGNPTRDHVERSAT